MLRILGTRGVVLEALKKSFLEIKFEDGLKIIKYPHEPLEVTANFTEHIEAKIGDEIVLECIATGFPFPKYIFYKNNVEINNDNRYVIKKFRYFIRIILLLNIEHVSFK